MSPIGDSVSSEERPRIDRAASRHGIVPGFERVDPYRQRAFLRAVDPDRKLSRSR